MAAGKVNNLLGTGFKSEKLVTSLRSVKSILTQVKNGKGKTVKRLMKETAQCLAEGMEERARTKVLSLIREEKLIHAMDSLEYHCDVVIQHIALLAKNSGLNPTSTKDSREAKN
ncbi:IST1 homolog [Dendrobates tinctorius]|uniref:IST1 homolog n=1 Tax=Dendrobates tinctorius TaxID=92724 RepID=UPI003CC93576